MDTTELVHMDCQALQEAARRGDSTAAAILVFAQNLVRNSFNETAQEELEELLAEYDPSEVTPSHREASAL